jgi:hypothetical protein
MSSPDEIFLPYKFFTGYVCGYAVFHFNTVDYPNHALLFFIKMKIARGTTNADEKGRKSILKIISENPLGDCRNKPLSIDGAIVAAEQLHNQFKSIPAANTCYHLLVEQLRDVYEFSYLKALQPSNEMPDWVNLFELPIEHFNVTYPV